MKMKDILFVLGLKKKLLSISALDNKCLRVAFIDGEVLMWLRGSSLEDKVCAISKLWRKTGMCFLYMHDMSYFDLLS